MNVFAELLDLVLPNLCVSCRQPATAQWCVPCRPTPDVFRCSWPGACAPPVEVWAAADYSGSVRQALLAYKERGQRRLAPPLAQLLAAAVRAASGPDSARPLVVVPVPSAAAAARERGGDHMLRVAQALSRTTAVHGGAGLEVAPVLRFRGRSADSVGLTAAQRAARDSPLRVKPPTDSQALGDVVIVDDIATTGATLAACAHALDGQGWRVRGAAVIAHTRLRHG